MTDTCSAPTSSAVQDNQLGLDCTAACDAPSAAQQRRCGQNPHQCGISVLLVLVHLQLSSSSYVVQFRSHQPRWASQHFLMASISAPLAMQQLTCGRVQACQLSSALTWVASHVHTQCGQGREVLVLCRPAAHQVLNQAYLKESRELQVKKASLSRLAVRVPSKQLWVTKKLYAWPWGPP